MKLIGIVGSNAKKSYNRTLLEFIKKHFSDSATIELLEVRNLPLFNESAKQDIPVIMEYNKKIQDADGVIIATPEHNHSITSSLKSLIEWLSNDVHPFNGKPVMIVGASYDVQGSSRAQLHLRQILDAPGVNAQVMPGHEFLLGQAQNAFDSEGNIKDSGTIDFLESCFKAFIRFTNVINLLNEPEDLEVTPGKYDVTAIGHNGKIPMSVEFSEDRIENIDIDTSGETKGIADTVFTRIPDEIVNGQTLNVDAVSGASITSNGVIEGVANAVKLAGGDPDILKRRPKANETEKIEPKEYSTDVVVIGGGGAGLSAAATVLQEGKNVILLEKFPAVGGNTIRTGGPMNAADPSWQNKFDAIPGEKTTLQGILEIDEVKIDKDYLPDFILLKKQITKYLDETTDEKEFLFDSSLFHRIQTYLGGKRVDLKGNEIFGKYDLVKVLTDDALDSVKWLEKIGVEFDNSEVAMPVGAKWRRGHKPLKNQGYAYISALRDFVNKNNGQIITDAPVKKLIIENGEVKGVISRNCNNQEIIVHASSVILASGGFGANTKMLQKYNTYWDKIDDDIKTSNSPAITGDGIRLGESAGAELVGMGFTQMMPVSDPNTGELFSGLQVPPANFVMVNQEGRRFVNEYEGRDVLSKAAIENGGLFYLIADDNIKATAYNTNQEKIDAQVEAGTLFRSDSIEGLAAEIKVDPSILRETIDKYNSYVESGNDPEFGKNVFDLKVVKPPFYATPRKPAMHHTMGGLKIDTKTHVIGKNGKIIPHLFAAGEVAGGIHAGNRLGGNSLTDIFTFGRIAGKTAVSENLQEK